MEEKAKKKRKKEKKAKSKSKYGCKSKCWDICTFTQRKLFDGLANRCSFSQKNL